MAAKFPENILLIVRFFSEISEALPEMAEKLSELLQKDGAGVVPASVILNIPADAGATSAADGAGFQILPSGRKGLPLLNLPSGELKNEIDVPGSFIMPVAADSSNTVQLDSLAEKNLSLVTLNHNGKTSSLTIISKDRKAEIPAVLINAGTPENKYADSLIQLKKAGGTAAIVFDFFPESIPAFSEFLDILKLKILRKSGTEFLSIKELEIIPPVQKGSSPVHSCSGPAATPLYRSRMVPAEIKSAAAGSRTLVANMSGHTQLAGDRLNLHFYKGRQTGVSVSKQNILNWTGGGTYFKTSAGVFRYTSESAFSFEDENEYGMRTLQYPEKLGPENRIITDFYFSDDCDDPLISIFAEYPAFPGSAVVYEAALNEIPLFDLRQGRTEIEYTYSDGNSGTLILDRDAGRGLIPGKKFILKSGKRRVEIDFINETGEADPGLPVKTANHRGRRFLFINPGGSYYPVPAWFFSGLKENIRFTFRAEQDSSV